ncbi:CPBP family intramembrane glutamic endopeptidase [Terrisporobacter petrolearius]|uniref:CPBP family intramembrane glutamic endopeptidase n=1 Tax=Terrisporobacter petrolearius TaxID=1460447 RepID=UPI0022E7C938|nr:type II CAAX endopeptidase family protein [Terrisporobacter petrolearius]
MKKLSIIEEATQGKRLLNIFIVLVLGLLIIFVGSAIGFVLISLMPPSLTSDNFWNMIFAHTLGFLPIAILVFGVIKAIEGRSLTSIGFRKNKFFIKFILGFLLGFLSFTIVTVVLLVTGNIAENPDTSLLRGVPAIGPVILVIFAWIVQSGTEEIFSRGWMLTSIGAKYNKVLAIIVTSLFFSVLHFTSGEVTIIAAINIALAGILLAIYVIKSNDLWGAIGWHSAWNWAQGSIYGFQVSGNDLKLPSIFQLHSVGNKTITGGNFGPEAGIVATFILVTIIIILLSQKSWFED